MHSSKVDRWLGPSLMLLALAWLWLVQIDIPDIRTEGEPGPRAFPILLGVVLAGLGLLMALLALLSTRRHVGRVLPDLAQSLTEAIPPLTSREAGVAAGTFGLLILYAFLLDKAGFVIATPVVIALTMAGLLRMRTWGAIASLAVGFTFGCWVIFDALLGTPLPRGSWVSWL